MVFVFILGMVAGLAAPILVRWAKAGGVTLAGAAALLVVAALTGVLNPDPREGLAAIEANRREYLFVLGCEVPVLAFALLSGEQEALLARMGNPHCLHSLRGSRGHLAELLLALVSGGAPPTGNSRRTRPLRQYS